MASYFHQRSLMVIYFLLPFADSRDKCVCVCVCVTLHCNISLPCILPLFVERFNSTFEFQPEL